MKKLILLVTFYSTFVLEADYWRAYW